MPGDLSKKVVIVHYHLRRGGVTRVIEAAAEALVGEGFDVLLLSGEAPLNDSEILNVRVVPALDYRKIGSSVIAESLSDALLKEATDYFSGEPDLWHFHNPTLAKNVLIPSVVRKLAERKKRVVLQLHDFPEDGRPGNYSKQRAFFDSEEGFEKTLYPVAKHIHYATINRRDHDFLLRAGIGKKNLHVLPNAIPDLPVTTTPKERPFSREKLFALYPTRGIRRKNLGELLLLSLIYGDRVDFATTLIPQNPDWLQVHGDWQRMIDELELPVKLGIAEDNGYDFFDLLGWSDFVVTTSIAEGFGLTFLEPWVAGKAVMGRDLPEITNDFSENGLDPGYLYKSIRIPVEWVDEAALEKEFESVLRRSYLAFDASVPKAGAKLAWKAKIQKGKVDFGVLSEPFQKKVLRRLKENPEELEFVEIPELPTTSSSGIASIRAVIREAYSLSQYGKRLSGVYNMVMSGKISRVKSLPPKKVLAQFLNPERLNLLRE